MGFRMERHKTRQRKVVHESRNFTLETEEIELVGGKVVTRDRVVHNGAAVMIPQMDDGRLIMVRQYRHSVREELVEFPAGTIDKGEQPLDCAKRELIEEVGQSARDWLSLGILYPCPGFCSEIQHVYLARGLSHAEQDRDEDELIELLPMNPREVVEAIKSHRVLDGKSIAAFYRAVISGNISL